jgi:hypothetical protein
VENRALVALTATVIGIGYTIYSEWLNTVVRESWSYAAAMPRLPVLGTGLTPVAQWLVLPPLGLWWSHRAVRGRTEDAQPSEGNGAGKGSP